MVSVDEEAPAIEEIDLQDTAGLDELILDDERFWTLDFDAMDVRRLDEFARRIGSLQVDEQREFFASVGVDNLSTISEEDYLARQAWLFTDDLYLPVRKDGRLTGEYALVGKTECPEIHVLREKVRKVHSGKAYAEREAVRRAEHAAKILSRFPQAVAVENADKTAIYYYDVDGSICGSRRVSTVGNF